jgi:uncharacterized protein (TIGR02246 family)
MIQAIVTLAFVVIVIGGPHFAAAAANDDVSGATRAWIDAMNGRNPDKVVTLYDGDAVLWGTVSPTIRDTRQAIEEYFSFLRTAPPEYKIVLGEQRVRVYGDMAINTGTYVVSTVREGKPATIPARFSFVYRNRNGRWMIVDHHSSAMPAPPQ